MPDSTTQQTKCLTKTNYLFIFVCMSDANEKLNEAIELAGGPKAIVNHLGLKSAMTVSQWKSRGLPIERVVDLARLTNWEITPHELAPKHYPNPDDALPHEDRL